MNNPNYLKEINIHAPSNSIISQNTTNLSKINRLTKESITLENDMKTFSNINHIGSIRSNSAPLTSKQVPIRFSELANKNENIILNKNVYSHNISSKQSFPIYSEKDKNNISSSNHNLFQCYNNKLLNYSLHNCFRIQQPYYNTFSYYHNL